MCLSRVCTGDHRRTGDWKQGRKVRHANALVISVERFVQVRGASIPVGTAIATFTSGQYGGHAAIFISQDTSGIQVWDQVRRMMKFIRLCLHAVTDSL